MRAILSVSDKNGLVEQSRPTRTFCVRDVGVTTCGDAAPAAAAFDSYCSLHTGPLAILPEGDSTS